MLNLLVFFKPSEFFLMSEIYILKSELLLIQFLMEYHLNIK
jgi:hypothetical protein